MKLQRLLTEPDETAKTSPHHPAVMAAAVVAQPALASETGPGLAADKSKMSPHMAAAQVHTPPETDETSHSHKDDDAASSSSLSDIGDLDVDPAGLGVHIEDAESDGKFEEAARAGAEAEQFSEVKPHHFDGGIPVFKPVCNL